MEGKTLYYLKKAGWYEGRKVDMTDFYEQLEAGGYVLFPAYKKFLDEFGRLEIKVNDTRYNFGCLYDYGRIYSIHSTIERDFMGYPPYK